MEMFTLLMEETQLQITQMNEDEKITVAEKTMHKYYEMDDN